jgi:transposase
LINLDVHNPRALLADKGYDGDDVRDSLLLKGILPVIPPKANRRNPADCDYRQYRDRNRIERMFNKIYQFRRIATRYDKTARSFLSFLAIAAVKLWLPTFVNRT